MKPQFALSLSMDGIALFHRAPAGWEVVGEVALDSADLPTELARLRDMAGRLRPGPALCKLVLPNEQIRYMHVTTGWADNAERKQLVEAALEGATPYELDELSYACAISGEVTHVAAVARETMEEAEDFATSHGFAPVSFVAMPEKADFPGEPFFGPTRGGPALLGPGGQVEPDYLVISVVGRARVPAEPVAEPAPPAAESAAPAEPAAPEAVPEDGTTEAPQAGQAPGETAPAPALEQSEGGEEIAAVESPLLRAVPASEPVATLAAEAAPPGTGAATGDQLAAASVEPDGTTDRVATSSPEPAKSPRAPEGEPAQDTATTPEAEPALDPEPTGPVAPEAGTRPDQAALSADTDAPAPAGDSAQLPVFRRAEDLSADTPASPRATPVEAPRSEASPVPTGPETPAPAFTSVRARRDAPESLAPPLAGVTRDQPGGVAAGSIDLGEDDLPERLAPPRRPEPAGPAEPPLSRDTPSPEAIASAASLSRPSPVDDDTVDAPEFLARPSPSAPPPPRRKPAPGRLSSLLSGLKRPARQEPRVSAPGPVPPTPRATPIAAPAADRESREAEAARMTVFGARPSQVVAKPRYLGLLLTLILMLFMMGVAAWASIFMSDEVSDLIRPGSLPQVAAAEDPVTAPVAAETALAGALPTEEEIAESEENVDLALAETVEPAPRTAALPEPVLREPIRQRAPEERPRAMPPVAETPDPEDEARYAATGVWVSAPWVTPAPIPGTLDDLYVASIDPAVPNLDAVALPVPEGDRADRTPGAQPDPAPPGTTFRIGDDGFVQPTPDGALTPDGVLVHAGPPARVPPARPAETLGTVQQAEEAEERAEELAEEVAALALKRPKLRPGGLVEENERMELGGFSRAELAAYRPKLRPALPEARQQAEEAAEEETDTGTAQAVAASRRPSARPAAFSATVAAAQAAAIQPVAVVAPRQTITPSVPSSGSVTRTATVRNAINLSTINLIGVYGQPSSRRALVRMSDGRYRKVKVGDNLDGGRVSAIGDGQLSYTKGGRSHTLTMPKG